MGFPNQFFSDSWVVGFGRTDHAHHHDGSGLDHHFAGIPGVMLASWREGPGRPEVSGGAAVFHGPHHHLAGTAGAIRQLEQRLEAVLAVEPGRHLEAFFDALAAMSETAHLVQMFDTSVVRAHVSAAGAKGGRMVRPSAARAAASRPKSISRSTSTGCRSPSI